MLDSWPEVCLAEVTSRVTVGHVGPMAHRYVERGVPFLRSQNVLPYRIDLSEAKSISTSFHDELRKSALHPGDVVVVRTGKPGTAAVIPEDVIEANCSDLVVVTPGPRLDAAFLVYYLNSASGKAHVGGRIVGSVQSHFNVGDARRLTLSLPPIMEQRAITRTLGALDDKIKLIRQMSETLESIVRAIFTSWFVDFDPVRAKLEGREPAGMDAETAALFPDSFEHHEGGLRPSGWTAGTFGDVAGNPRRGVPPEEIEADTPYVGLEHMPRRSIALHKWDLASGLASTKFGFARNEILFGKLRPYFYKIGVAPIDGVCSTDILVIEPRVSGWFSFALGHAMSDEFVQHADATSTGTKMPRTSWKELARYELALPPREIAEAFDRVARPMIERIVAGIHESRTVAALRDTLLPKLISGEIRIRDAERAIPV